MLRISQLRLPIDHEPCELTERVRKILRYRQTPEITIVRRSIDARKKPRLFFNYVVDVKVGNEDEVWRRCRGEQVERIAWKPYRFPVSGYEGKLRPVIIGTGPAGLFCGYYLAQAGFRPILLERGEPVEKRPETVQAFWESGKLNPESNVQFGEGGAGAFSDGKLNTLVKDKYGRNREVLSLFVKYGAPREILYDHKPHIGTDILCQVVRNLRQAICGMGGEIRFGARVTDLETEDGRLSGVVINAGERLKARTVVLAPGHSARDTFLMLHERGIHMEARPFAVGLRVEHPQELINLSQYGQKAVERLGSAPYKVTARASDGRGVYSFCMCPGGYVVNASSEPGRLAVNGMSYSKRDGSNANSAIIVSVTVQDYGSDHPLAGIEFQRRLEERAYQAGRGKVPVERYGDFRSAILGPEEERRPALDRELIPESFAPCIKGAWEFSAVHEILPAALGRAFVEGMEQFGKAIGGFNHPNVLVDGLESRTSSPVRIVRDKESLQSSLKGLYPCGEGAGYAGGIMSAAMDGIRVAEAAALAAVSGGA